MLKLTLALARADLEKYLMQLYATAMECELITSMPLFIRTMNLL